MTQQAQNQVQNKRPNQPEREPQPGMRWTRNLMSGKYIEIPIDTPMCCDPGTETYWSM